MRGEWQPERGYLYVPVPQEEEGGGEEEVEVEIGVDALGTEEVGVVEKEWMSLPRLETVGVPGGVVREQEEEEGEDELGSEEEEEEAETR